MLFIYFNEGTLVVTKELADSGRVVWKGDYDEKTVEKKIDSWLKSETTVDVEDFETFIAGAHLCTVEKINRRLELGYWLKPPDGPPAVWIEMRNEVKRTYTKNKIAQGITLAFDISRMLRQTEILEEKGDWIALNQIQRDIESDEYDYIPQPELQYFGEHIMNNLDGAIPVDKNIGEFRDFLLEYIRFTREDQFESEHAFYCIADGFRLMDNQQALMALELLLDEEQEVRETVLAKLAFAYKGDQSDLDYISLLKQDNLLSDEMLTKLSQQPGTDVTPKTLNTRCKEMILNIVIIADEDKLNTRLVEFRISDECPAELGELADKKMIERVNEFKSYDTGLKYLHRVFNVQQTGSLAFQIGFFHYKRDEFESAISFFANAFTLEPGHREALKYHGYLCMEQERFKEAIYSYSQLLSGDEYGLEAAYGCGRSYMALEQFNEALPGLDRVVELDADYEDVLFYRAQTHFKLAHSQHALDDYSRYIKHNPDPSVPYYNRGSVHMAMNNYRSALDDFNACLERDPNDLHAFHNKAFCLRKLEMFNEALAEWTALIEKKPGNRCDYHLQRGSIYLYDTKEFERAVEEFKTAHQINPDSHNATVNLGISYTNMKDYDAAIKYYSLAVDAEFMPGLVFYNRGLAYYRKKDYQNAARDFDRAVKESPEAANSFNMRASNLYELGKYEEAYPDSMKACSLDKEDGEYFVVRSLILLKLGRKEEAEADLDVARKLSYEPDEDMSRKLDEAGVHY